MTDDELLEQAARFGYRVVEDGAVWRVLDVDRAWQPCMLDRSALMRTLAGRLGHVRSDPNRVPWTPPAR